MVSRFVLSLLLASFVCASGFFSAFNGARSRYQRSTNLHDIPLELEGRLTPGNKWTVKFIYQGEERDVEVPEDCSILESAEKIWDDIDSSCRNGVCTTCAGQVSFFSSVHVLNAFLYAVQQCSAIFDLNFYAVVSFIFEIL